MTISRSKDPQITNKVYEFKNSDALTNEQRELAKTHCGAQRIVLVAEKDNSRRKRRAIIDSADACDRKDVPCIRTEMSRCMNNGHYNDIMAKCRFLQANNCWFKVTCIYDTTHGNGLYCNVDQHMVTMTYCCTNYCRWNYSGTSCWDW